MNLQSAARLVCAASVALAMSIPQPAHAKPAEPKSWLRLEIGSGPATYTSTWAHLHPHAEHKRCENKLQIDLRMKVHTNKVNQREVRINRVTLEWKAKTGGHFAGYTVYNQSKSYAGGRFGDLGEPEVRPGADSRTVTVGKRARFGKDNLLYWEQNFSFSGEDFGGSIGKPDGTGLSPCHSSTVWFIMSPFKRSGSNPSCTPLTTVAVRSAAPTDRC